MTSLSFIKWGDEILEIFGPGFSSAHKELIIIGFGYLVSSFSGPTTQILEMSGLERLYFIILSFTTGISLALIPFAASYWGSAGVATCISFNIVSLNICSYFAIYKRTGISPGMVRLDAIKWGTK